MQKIFSKKSFPVAPGGDRYAWEAAKTAFKVRIVYVVLALLFYYIFGSSYFTFEMPSYPSKVSIAEWSIAPVGSILLLLIALFFTPFIIGTGVFLFLKYPKQKRGDFWHYCLIYPGFALFAVALALLIWNL